MSIKDKFKELKNELLVSMVSKNSRDYEFYANLKDHELGNQDLYRLYFINYHRIGETRDVIRSNNIGIINWPFKPFKLPESMSREDAFKILSYLTDYIERELSLEPCSYASVSALDNVIDLKRLGFERVDVNLDDNSDDVINLFTISGRVLLFEKSPLYQKYFEWYKEGVTFDEVKKIYEKCGIDFYDLVPVTKENENKTNIPMLNKEKKDTI